MSVLDQVDLKFFDTCSMLYAAGGPAASETHLHPTLL